MHQLLRALFISMWFASSAFAANQTVNTKPDAKITFDAALSGVTRLSIRGKDRIKELWSNNSAYEAQLNEDTGDMFLRYIGTGRPASEDGFIVTEKGYTINYTLKPKKTTSETVLIALAAPKEKSEVPASEVAFKTTTGSSGSGYSGKIVGFVRQIYASHLDDRSPPSVRSGTVVRSVSGPGLRAKILAVKAGGQGGSVQAQKFYRKGVLAVFVDQPVLAPGQRTWVVVVEGR